MKASVGWDLEIGTIVTHFPDWKDYRPLDITCAGFAPSDSDRFSVSNGTDFFDKQTALHVLVQLETYVGRGFNIVTHNGVAFDFILLADTSGEYERCKALALGDSHIDTMFSLFYSIGYRVPLGTLGKETLGMGKLMKGKDAPVQWNKGNTGTVLEYVKEDATISMMLERKAQQQGFVLWRSDRGFGAKKKAVNNAYWNITWTVGKHLQTSPRIAEWMTNPIQLEEFIGEWV